MLLTKRLFNRGKHPRPPPKKNNRVNVSAPCNQTIRVSSSIKSTQFLNVSKYEERTTASGNLIPVFPDEALSKQLLS